MLKEKDFKKSVKERSKRLKWDMRQGKKLNQIEKIFFNLNKFLFVI